MKLLLLFVTGCLIAANTSAQISIGQVDLPQPGSSYILTSAVPDPGIDLSDTGPDQVWDYQQLQPVTSTGDTFYNMSSVSLLYQLLYSGANLAGKSAIAVSIDQLTLEDVFMFYKNSAGAYEQYGFAGTIDGLPVPIIYGTNDVIYQFPIQYGKQDSSESDFSLGIPGLGYVSQQRKRVNHADGWGTIKTPVGVFETIRVVSEITDVDSVYIDTLNYGTKVTLKSYEYKWLAADKGQPVFQINAQDVADIPVVTQIVYQDTAFQTSVDGTQVNIHPEFSVYPNPVSDILTIKTNEANLDENQLLITDLHGRILLESEVKQPQMMLNMSGWENGVYMLHLRNDRTAYGTVVVVQH